MSRVTSFSIVSGIAVLFLAGSAAAQFPGDGIPIPCERRNLNYKLPAGFTGDTICLPDTPADRQTLIKVSLATILGFGGATGPTGESFWGGPLCPDPVVNCVEPNSCICNDTTGNDFDGLRETGVTKVTITRGQFDCAGGEIKYRVTNPNAFEVEELLQLNCTCLPTP